MARELNDVKICSLWTPCLSGLPFFLSRKMMSKNKSALKTRQMSEFCKPKEVCVLGSGFLDKDTDTHCACGLFQSSFTSIHWADSLKSLCLLPACLGCLQHSSILFFTIDCHSSVLLPQTHPKLILGGLKCFGISSKAQINVWVTSAVHLVTFVS